MEQLSPPIQTQTMSMFRTVQPTYKLLPRLANIKAVINRMHLKPLPRSLPINKAVSSRLEMLIKFRVLAH